MQKDDITLPVRHTHSEIDEARQFLRELRQLMEMGREQCARAIDLMQMFNTSPGNRQAIKSRCAATDLIEDDKRTRACLIENGGSFHHLNHEG